MKCTRESVWPTFGSKDSGRLANICGDLCEIDAVAEGILKRLTGQDNLARCDAADRRATR